MALTAEDLRDLVVLLEAHPEWRKVLWALLASEEVLRMPTELAELRAETERRFTELAEAVRRLSELFIAHRQEFLAQQAHTDARLTELTETVRRLSELFIAHRQEFLAYQAQTEARLMELSAAVRNLAEEVRALAEAQRRTEESLAAHRAETDRRFAELAEAQRRHYEEFAAHRQEFLAYREETDRRFAELSAEVRALAQAQRRTEEILQQVLLRQEQFQRTLDHFGQIIGPITEEHMVQALQEWIAQQGGMLLTPVVSMTLDGLGEVDGLARARLPDGQEAWLLISAKAKVWARTITEFVERILRHPEARERLQAQGVGDPVLPVVFGRALDHRALEAAQRAQVGLLIGRQGMLVPPVLWSLSEGKPLG
ncbi:hypothetical protein [Thermoflexus hugenholtzii]